jgi:DNA-binding NarL/FixJ family response regulator
LQAETIIVADDHPVFRDGLCALIRNAMPGAEVRAADSYEGAIRLARESNPSPAMFVLDLMFSRRSIMPELPALRRTFSRASIVVVSMVEDRTTIGTLMAHGLNGFINKSVPPQDIATALTGVRAGDVVICMPGEVAARVDSISERQLQVLSYMAEGRTNKEIALALSLSPFTVRVHVSALFQSLGVGSRAEAVAKGIKDGLIPLG